MKLVFERLRESFWVLPGVAIVFAILAGYAVPALDQEITLPDAVSFGGGVETARAVLQVIATVAITVAGISFSVIVVALVLASQQLSPRVLRSFQRNPLNQVVVALFLATAAFALFVLGAVDDGQDAVPELSVTAAMLLAAVSLVTFVAFLHHLIRSLNASALIRRISAEGHQAIEDPYPRPAHAAPDDLEAAEADARALTERLTRSEVRAPRAGYVASVKVERIIAAASRRDAFVEQEAAIGEFTLTGGLLATLWSEPEDSEELGERIDAEFILNEERIVDDDVGFPLRQLADIALKGLSPGINDPTTAENAMDSVTDTLVRLGHQGERTMLCVDGEDVPRFRATSPDFDALVRLGFEEVRHDGTRRPAFSIRLLELLAGLREVGGDLARESAEVARQAELVCRQASERAELEADRELIRETYERLFERRAS